MKAKITDIIKITPVKKYAPPKYPTRTNATSDPKLLRKLPSRWEKNAAVVAAVGMLGAMTLTSCGVTKIDSAFEGQEVTENIQEYTEPEEEYFALEGEPAVAEFTTEQEVTYDMGELAGDVIFEIPTEQEVVTLNENIDDISVYPYPFDYDLMRPVLMGTSGPPAFLSEEDALAIINNMVESEGLKFESDLSQTPIYAQDIKLYDSENQVAITYYRWYNPIETTNGNYITTDGIATGRVYNPENWDDLENKEKQKILTEWTEKNISDEEVRSILENDLREQVRDFIEWLQGQGII